MVFAVIWASVLKTDVSAWKGFALVGRAEDVFGPAKSKESGFQITIEFPFIPAQKKKVVCGAAHKQLKAKK